MDRPAATSARQTDSPGPSATARVLAAALSLAVAAILVGAVLELPDRPAGLTSQVLNHLGESGVTQPVTAVLLNFRGYDTWLEVAVVLLAALAVLALQRSNDLVSLPVPSLAEPVLAWLVRLLVPVLVLAAGYLLWLGTHAPGGAFQAGALIGAAGVLLLIAGRRSIDALGGWRLRLLLLAGFALFLLVATGPLLAGLNLLEYPSGWAGTLIVPVELAVMLSIGATLALLFAAAHPSRPRVEEREPPSGGRPESA